MSDNEENNTVQRGTTTADVKAMLPGLIVASDLMFAIIFWTLRESILGQNENTDMIAAIVCGILVIGGVFTALVLKHTLKK